MENVIEYTKLESVKKTLKLPAVEVISSEKRTYMTSIDKRGDQYVQITVTENAMSYTFITEEIAKRNIEAGKYTDDIKVIMEFINKVVAMQDEVEKFIGTAKV